MIAVVIPAYRVKRQVVDVIRGIGSHVHAIYLVDDACPEKSGEWARSQAGDPRVRYLFHERNQGVGGAMVTGFEAALREGCEVIVKIDGDGQMNPALIPHFVDPILAGRADYCKGNRFFDIRFLKEMPWIRLFGNTCLSFLTKLTTGYWSIMDPTNGYFAVHADALRLVPLTRLSKRYFFETDLLFRLYIARAVVREVPMRAKYSNETSSLSIPRVLIDFPPKFFVRFLKRIAYIYFIRDFNLASLALLLGFPLLGFGTIFGLIKWYKGYLAGAVASSGTVMLASLPVIVGLQFLLAAVIFDLFNAPKEVVHKSGASGEPV